MSEEDDEVKILLESWSSSEKAFDKMVTYIASGAFAISFGFIDKVVDIKHACNNWIFLLSLCCFALPVMAGLYNFFREKHTLEKFIELYRSGSPHQSEYKEQANKKSNMIRIYQMISLILGSMLLLLYIALNTRVF